MVQVFENLQNSSCFIISDLSDYADLKKRNTFKILWCRTGTLECSIDLEPLTLTAHQVVCVAPTQRLEITETGESCAFEYNREFYCLVDHDREVSCVGLLYYGSVASPVITLDERNRTKFELLIQVFEDEFETRDNIQEEMLRMLLKRLIILCTRLYKTQSHTKTDENELDIIRQFHLLVESHFREKQKVTDYADLMFKSPKTLANVFAKNGEIPPLKQIQNRIALEAKRMLVYSDKAIKEIGWELHFEEEAHFSRFFKRNIGMSPSAFRSSMKADFSEL